MQKRTLKRPVYGGLLIFLLAAAVPGVHIYILSPAPDPHLRVMARIDFKRDIGMADSVRISARMYGRPGVDHDFKYEKSGL